MVSSRSASPASTCPCCSRIRPCWWRAQAIEVCVAAALADRGGVGCSGVRGFEVTRFEALLDHRQQQIAPLGALARVALQQPLGTGKPAGRAAHLAAHEQAKAEPERAADGASALAGVQMSVVGTFKCPEVFIVPTDQVCRHRQQFEILGLQRSFLIGARERLERIGPGTLPKRPACSIELAHPSCLRTAAAHVPHSLCFRPRSLTVWGLGSRTLGN